MKRRSSGRSKEHILYAFDIQSSRSRSSSSSSSSSSYHEANQAEPQEVNLRRSNRKRIANKFFSDDHEPSAAKAKVKGPHKALAVAPPVLPAVPAASELVMAPSILVKASSSVSKSHATTTTTTTTTTEQQSGTGQAADMFISCLHPHAESPQSRHPRDSSPRGMQTIVLRRALSLKVLDDDGWLSSSFIDNVVTKFAKCYTQVSFLSTDFASFTSNMNVDEKVTDIRGQVIDYSNVKKPIVFVFNSQNIHWNLLRIIRHPVPEMQLFEPMGMPHKRHGGLSFRNVPRAVIEWLDVCMPLKTGESWIKVGSTAILKPQQLTSYDCGVACLLYAEKCGKGETKEEINAETNQGSITNYRKVLQVYLQKINSLSDQIMAQY